MAEDPIENLEREILNCSHAQMDFGSDGFLLTVPSCCRRVIRGQFVDNGHQLGSLRLRWHFDPTLTNLAELLSLLPPGLTTVVERRKRPSIESLWQSTTIGTVGEETRRLIAKNRSRNMIRHSKSQSTNSTLRKSL